MTNKASVLRQNSLGRTDMFKVRLDAIKIADGFNARDFNDPANQAHVRHLANLLRENGQEDPVKVRVDGSDIYLVNGESRYRAAMLNKAEGSDVDFLWATKSEQTKTDIDLKFDMVVMNEGKPLTAVEKARAVAWFLENGVSLADIAKRFADTEANIRHLSSLAAAPVAVREQIEAMITRGVSTTEALRTLRQEGENAIVVLEKAREIATAAGSVKVRTRHIAQAKDTVGKKTATPAGKLGKGDLVEVLKEILAAESLVEAQKLAEDALATLQVSLAD